MAYRAALVGLGFAAGFQWCNGSFAEQKGTPSDIDIVTFFRRPANAPTPNHLAQLAQQHPNVFQSQLAKQHYHCDAYFVDLDLPSANVVGVTHYWYGLFSHTKANGEWKGLIEVPLNSPADDAAATAQLVAWRADPQVAP